MNFRNLLNDIIKEALDDPNENVQTEDLPSAKILIDRYNWMLEALQECGNYEIHLELAEIIDAALDKAKED